MSRIHGVYFMKVLRLCNSFWVGGGGVSVWYMNRWSKQHVDSGTRTNRTKWATWAEAWRGSQSSPGMRLRWTYSRGAADDSCSSLYECDRENNDVALRLLMEKNVTYVSGCAINLFIFLQVKNKLSHLWFYSWDWHHCKQIHWSLGPPTLPSST